MSNPVDELLPPLTTSNEAADNVPDEERPELSLLSAVDVSEMQSIGDLPRSPAAATVATVAKASVSKTTQMLQTRFDNGKVKVERFVTEDAKGNLINHGPYKEFDASGTLIRSGSYALGNLDGAWSQTVPTEKVQSLSTKMDAGFKPPFKSEANFVDGQLHGDWTIVDSKRSPVFLWQFDMGSRDNVSTWFDSRHTAVLEMTYAADVPNGASSQIVQGQREPKKVVFDHGRVVETKTNWYEKGKKRSEEMFLSSAAKKLVSHDWWNSTVVSESLPEGRLVRQGSYTTWHPNGQKSAEGYFVAGAPDGEFKWWYLNSQMQSKGTYKNGSCLGEWVWYHPNGMKMMEGSYAEDVQVGQWSSWNDEGQLKLRAGAAEFPIVKQELDLEQVVNTASAPSISTIRQASRHQPASKRR